LECLPELDDLCLARFQFRERRFHFEVDRHLLSIRHERGDALAFTCGIKGLLELAPQGHILSLAFAVLIAPHVDLAHPCPPLGGSPSGVAVAMQSSQ
jgi:hypothetical protein